MPIVDRKTYVPTETTITYLKNKHYTREHIWDIVQKFRINFDGREFKNIEEKFKKVMCLEAESNAPQKPIETHEIDLSHRADDSVERAAEVKQDAPMFTKQEAIAEYEKRRGNANDETAHDFKSWIK